MRLTLAAAVTAIFVLHHGLSASPEVELIERIDLAQAAAARFLIERQSPDGAWRSSTYGFMKDGPSLTSHVGYALLFAPQAGPEAERAFDRSAGFLASMLDENGELRADVKLIYPVYTLAQASWHVAKRQRTPENLGAQRAFRDLLRRHQLAEANGWAPADIEYGGWGYALDPPRRPAAGHPRGPWDFSNLSATLYGLGALQAAGAPRDDAAWAAALVFVRRCQNFSDDPEQADAAFDDGGFFFSPAEAIRNKAGVAGVDRHGRQRFHSYGSMTADGLRALLACGLPKDHPRVHAAAGWLERHFDVRHNPGTFAAGHEDLRDATWYYYMWSLSHAMMHLDRRMIDTPAGPVDWPAALAEELLRRQQADGSWTNPFTDAREDDPLVSAPFAIAALAICRQVITGEEATLHAGTPGGAIARLVEMGIEPYQITSTLFAVVAQRLLRRRDAEPVAAPSGASYRGRVPVAEIARLDAGLRRLVLAGADAERMQEELQRQGGYVTLRAAAAQAVARGLTDADEVRRVLGE